MINKIKFILLTLILLITPLFCALSNNILNYKIEKDTKSTINKPIKLAIMNRWDTDNLGNNIHYKLIDLLKKYGKLNIVTVSFNNWNIGYKQALSGKNIDGIMGLSWTKKREKKDFFFTKPYQSIPYYLIVKDNSKINNINDLNNKILYVNQFTPLKQMIREKIPSIKFTDDKAKADALISLYTDFERIKNRNFKIVDTIYDKYGEISIGINHKNKELFLKIQEALKLIPKEELQNIKNDNKLRFTKDESNWLNKNLIVNYKFNPSNKPIEWINEVGEHKGIIADIIKEIELKSNIKFKSNSSLTKQTVMISATVKDNIRNLNYSKNTIFSTPYVFVSKKDNNHIYGFDNLKDKKIGILKNSPFIKIIKEYKKDISCVKFDTIEDGFKMLNKNTIDIFITNSTTAKYYINVLNFNNLSITYKTIFNLDLRIAIDKAMNIELLSIIDKSINAITKKQFNNITHKWSTVRVEKTKDWTFVLQVFGITILLFIILFVSNYRLKILVKNKTKDIEKQKNEIENTLSSLTKNVMFTKTDLDWVITDASELFCKLSGYTQDELIGKSHDIMIHPDTPNEFVYAIKKSLKNEIPIVKEFKSLKKDGSSYWVETLFAPDYDSTGKLIGYSGIKQDITDKKEVEGLSKEVEETQREVVFTMGAIGESRSKETGNHVKRVAEYSELLAIHYGLNPKDAVMLKEASPMHDIGKVGIPDIVLNKPGRFNDEERKIMDTHAQLGYDMLKSSTRKLMRMAAIVAYEHHEKYNGTGYPNKLKGKEIHIYGRITALADVFDALGSHRVYKKAWDDERIFKMIKEERGEHFDPKLVDIFFDNLDDFLKIRDSFKDI